MYPYRGGLLSGWRITSLLGSLVSLAASEYIIERSNLSGSVDCGVMGDDVVLTGSTYSIPSENMVQLYNEFGLHANLSKTVSSHTGEFLRKARSPGGSWAFPALEMKTITHAAPWITNTQYLFEDECAIAWHTFLSRLLPHCTDPIFLSQYIHKLTVSDLSNRFGRHIPWDKWLSTPLTAGGGGYVERAHHTNWTILIKKTDSTALSPFKKLSAIVGVYKPPKKSLNIPVPFSMSRRALDKYLNFPGYVQHTDPIPYFKNTANITESLWKILNNRISTTELSRLLTFPLPHRYRKCSPNKLVQLLTSGTKSIDSLPSICHTHECSPHVSHTLSTLTRQLMARQSGIPTNLIKPIVTAFAMQQYRNIPAPYGTW